MPRRRKPSTSDSADLAARSARYPQGVASLAVKLSQPDRMKLIAILHALQEAEDGGQGVKGDPCGICEAARERVKKEALNRKGIRGGIGSFEDKIINGCGPYRYLRYWFGKTHKAISSKDFTLRLRSGCKLAERSRRQRVICLLEIS